MGNDLFNDDAGSRLVVHDWLLEGLGRLVVVLVIDENVVNTRRGSWRMAEVVATYTGDDNLVRIVDVKCADGNTLKRPITKLVPLINRAERMDL